MKTGKGVTAVLEFLDGAMQTVTDTGPDWQSAVKDDTQTLKGETEALSMKLLVFNSLKILLMRRTCVSSPLN